MEPALAPLHRVRFTAVDFYRPVVAEIREDRQRSDGGGAQARMMMRRHRRWPDEFEIPALGDRQELRGPGLQPPDLRPT